MIKRCSLPETIDQLDISSASRCLCSVLPRSYIQRAWQVCASIKYFLHFLPRITVYLDAEHKDFVHTHITIFLKLLFYLQTGTSD